MKYTALLTLLGLASVSSHCSFDGDTHKNVSYDVTHLFNPKMDWTWEDPSFGDRDGEYVMYNYTFNICGNVVQKPDICEDQLPGIKAPAYQWNDQYCFALGDVIDSSIVGNKPEMRFYDEDEPALGFVMTYEADSIESEECGKKGSEMGYRTFSIVFRCASVPFPEGGPTDASVSAFIDEVDKCAYEAYSSSLAGCPKECPVVDGQLCSGNGICGYDEERVSARCFCDDGYDSVDCATPTSSPPSGRIAGATFGGILLGASAIFAYGFFMAKRIGTREAVSGFYSQA